MSNSGKETYPKERYRIKKQSSRGALIKARGLDRSQGKTEDNMFAASKPSLITIYNLDYLFSISVRFAFEHEIFSNDLGQLCLENSYKWLELERLELHKAWNLIGICLSDINTNLFKLKNWGTNPLGKNLALRLLSTFEEQGDIQNIALLSALILGSETKILENLMEV